MPVICTRKPSTITNTRRRARRAARSISRIEPPRSAPQVGLDLADARARRRRPDRRAQRLAARPRGGRASDTSAACPGRRSSTTSTSALATADSPSIQRQEPLPAKRVVDEVRHHDPRRRSPPGSRRSARRGSPPAPTRRCTPARPRSRCRWLTPSKKRVMSSHTMLRRHAPAGCANTVKPTATSTIATLRPIAVGEPVGDERAGDQPEAGEGRDPLGRRGGKVEVPG